MLENADWINQLKLLVVKDYLNDNLNHFQRIVDRTSCPYILKQCQLSMMEQAKNSMNLKEIYHYFFIVIGGYELSYLDEDIEEITKLREYEIDDTIYNFNKIPLITSDEYLNIKNIMIPNLQESQADRVNMQKYNIVSRYFNIDMFKTLHQDQLIMFNDIFEDYINDYEKYKVINVLNSIIGIFKQNVDKKLQYKMHIDNIKIPDVNKISVLELLQQLNINNFHDTSYITHSQIEDMYKNKKEIRDSLLKLGILKENAEKDETNFKTNLASLNHILKSVFNGTIKPDKNSYDTDKSKYKRYIISNKYTQSINDILNFDTQYTMNNLFNCSQTVHNYFEEE